MPRGVYKRGRNRLPVDAVRVWVFIAWYVEKRGFPPTYREMAAACFMGVAGVSRCLLVLELEGYIEREDGAARGITLLEKPPPSYKHAGDGNFDPS